MKILFNKTLIYGAFVTLVATSCANDNEKASSDDNRVAARISAGVQTRVENNVWNESDAIGISMIDPKDGTILSPYANYNYVTAGDGNFSPAQAGKIIYLPVDGKEVSFKAYYPYSGSTPASQVLPVSVGNQNLLADIDLMTAEHVSGTSINDPHVKLHFYHRLAKVFVDLSTDETGLIDLKGCKLTVTGLKTKASYNLMKEALTADDASTADINIPISNGKGEAIWLPRTAGEGITFVVTTANGGTYTARMDADLELKAGYKHTFHIRLKSTPVVVSATIEEWLEGPERKSDVIRVVTGLKDSKDFVANDTLRLFLKDKDQSDFGYLSTFTYGTNGKWATSTPTYWENIAANPAVFRGATLIDRKLNSTQMDDILVSKDIDVNQYTGVNLEMQHAGSKVIVELKSEDGAFTAADLKNATITLPNYLNSGSIDPQTGMFVPGTNKADIEVEGGVAIFPPQLIANGKLIAQISINGRTYDVKADEANGFEYKAGVANKLVMNLSKAKVEMSAIVAPWTEERHEFQDVRIATAALGTNGGDLQNGDKLYIYTGNSANRTKKGEYFTYDGGTNSWTYSNTSNPLYWEDIALTDGIYGFIERPAISGSAGTNQLPDYIVTPTPVANGGGATNAALHLQMQHAVAKVIVIVKSQSVNVTGATVVLPGYMTGGVMNNGIFVPGNTKADITLDKLSGNASSVTDAAYLQPQNIAGNSTIVSVTVGGRTYNASKNEAIKYEAGKATTLIVNLEKAGIGVSATVTGWDSLPSDEFDALDFTAGSSSANGFTNGDKLTMYKIASGKVADSNDTYSVSNTAITATNNWFRGDFATGDKICAVYPNSPVVNKGNDSFDWTADGSNDHSKDVLVAADGVVRDASVQVNLTFKHVLSKITINVCAGDGFTTDELKDCEVMLKQLIKEGTVQITTGIATAKGGVPADITPSKVTPNTIVNKKVAASFEAFIMPQTVSAGTLVTVTPKNGVTYEAKLTTTKTFNGGEEYVYNITFAKAGISFDATVADWTPGTGGDITID